MPVTKVRDGLAEAGDFRWSNFAKLFAWVAVLILVVALLDLVGMWLTVWTTPPETPGG